MDKSRRNRNAGKHPSYDKLNMSEERRKKKIVYDAEYNKRPEEIKKRVEANRANRKAGTYGKMTAMGKDRSHTKDGKLVLESRKTNRARNGQNGKSTKK